MEIRVGFEIAYTAPQPTVSPDAFSNGWAGDHYIWCGVVSGSGQLFLTIADGSGNTLAQSSQYIQIQDIKQMYVTNLSAMPPDLEKQVDIQQMADLLEFLKTTH